MTWTTELVPVADLKPHPRNYRTHTDAQLAHIERSLQDHGFYRNVIVARDLTLLAGHGVVLAATRLQLPAVPVVKLDLEPDDPRALKVLIGDNQIGQLAAIDDRELTDMLKAIHLSELTDLVGTGYDAQQLAALVMVTRPASEIEDFDAAAEWVGLPTYDSHELEDSLKVMVHCQTEEDRQAFLAYVQAEGRHLFGTAKTRSIWWPLKERTKTKDMPAFEAVD
jgi:ParB-like chromosome segregation protein Spo0J